MALNLKTYVCLALFFYAISNNGFVYGEKPASKDIADPAVTERICKQLASDPYNKKLLASLKKTIGKLPDANEQYRCAAIYYMGMVLTKNHAEAAKAKAFIAKKNPNSVYLQIITDRNLFDICRACHGKGVIDSKCSACGGSGKCKACKGQGSMSLNTKAYNKTSSFRSVSRDESRAMDKSVKCTRCAGSGRCKTCNGKGRTLTKCKECKGRGEFLANNILLNEYQAMLKKDYKFIRNYIPAEVALKDNFYRTFYDDNIRQTVTIKLRRGAIVKVKGIDGSNVILIYNKSPLVINRDLTDYSERKRKLATALLFE